VLAVSGAAAVSSCASPPPPPPPPTIVELTISAAPDENPDATGAASPANVVIFQLAATGSFEKADYFQLAQKPDALLGQDLVAKDQRIVAPGQQAKVTIAAKPDAKFLGIIVGYRNIDGSTWRGDVPIPPN
jgi:type VI secretion system protein VasD